jgi:hypothetical protein
MWFRGSITPPVRPLSTLGCALAGRQRMTRGQRDWLDLRCRALSSPAPCRFIPTLSPIDHHVANPEQPGSRTEIRLGARAHTTRTTNHAQAPPTPKQTNPSNQPQRLTPGPCTVRSINRREWSAFRPALTETSRLPRRPSWAKRAPVTDAPRKLRVWLNAAVARTSPSSSR